MSYSSAGVYTNVSGATTAAAGQTVQSAVWNNIHTDLASALTQVMQQTISGIGFRNALAANGSLDIWQRTAGGLGQFNVPQNTTQYTADRWYIATGANQAYTITQAAGLTNASISAAKILRNAAQTGTTAVAFGYPLDFASSSVIFGDDINKLLGNKVTLTGVIKAGANWSPASGTINISVVAGTGTPVKQSVGYTNQTSVIASTINLTPGGATTAFSFTSAAVVPLTTQQMEVQFSWTPVGTAGADDSFTIDDIQLEANLSSGTWTPTTYDRIPFEICLLMCKRHYQKTYPYIALPAAGSGLAGALGATAVATQRLCAIWVLPIEMRGSLAPAVTTFIPLTGTSANWYDLTASVSVAAVVDATNATSGKSIFIYSTVSGSTTNDLCYIHAQADKGI